MSTTRFLRLPEVCNITGLSKGGIYKLIREEKFPPPVKLTGRSSGWPEGSVRQWADARTPEPSRWAKLNGGSQC